MKVSMALYYNMETALLVPLGVGIPPHGHGKYKAEKILIRSVERNVAI